MDFFDKRATLQVIGCILKKHEILDDPDYNLDLEDFPERFHKILFATISNLFNDGVQKIDVYAIESYISKLPEQYEIFTSNKGIIYIQKAIEIAEVDNFNYNYNTLKKLSLLRYYEKMGLDTTPIYDTKVLDPKKVEEEQAKFDNYTVESIIDKISLNFVDNPKVGFCTRNKNKGGAIGEGLKELVESYKEKPLIGISMQSKFLNFLFSGSRLGCVYLRSGGTGSGKSRLSIADSCCYSIPYFHNGKEWVYTGFKNPTLILSCELSKEEVSLIVLSYVSGIKENIIKKGLCTTEQEQIVAQAVKYIEDSPLYIEEIPKFNITDVVNLIKKYKREKQVYYFNFDYLHTTVELISQVANISKGVRLREDHVLYMFADKLKEIAVSEGVHIDTATQLNGEYEDRKYKDQNVLRGAKSIPDRFDVAYICMPATKTELDAIEPFLKKQIIIPNLTKQNTMVCHIYKVRAGERTRIKVFLKVDLSNQRVEDLCCTSYDNEIIDIEKLDIRSLDKLLEENSVKYENNTQEDEEREFEDGVNE